MVLTFADEKKKATIAANKEAGDGVGDSMVKGKAGTIRSREKRGEEGC